jgi:aryl-alcohol dehydrogenase-like predicted oxidoreductase
MRYKLFGRSGLRVSELCLGAMTFGKDWGPMGADDNESRAMFDTFANAGGNFIDSAYMYTNGASERLVGEFIAADRDHFVIATKYTPDTGPDLIKSGNSRKNMRRCVEESLRRLKTDYIDLYWLHWLDGTALIDEIMRAFDDLVSSGKVLYVAMSNTPAWQISRANMLADLQGWAPIIGIQAEYSLIKRTSERELLPMAKELDLGITAWSPLAEGILTGKYNDDGKVTSRRPRTLTPLEKKIATAVTEVAREIGRTPNQVALAWIQRQQRYGTIIPILGARTKDQLLDNMGCLEVTFDDAQLARLEDISKISLGFPHDCVAAARKHLNARNGELDQLDNHRAYRETTRFAPAM